MISTGRQQLWSILLDFSDRYPQWRFGQMVTNIAGWVANESWAMVDDERLVQAALGHLDRRFGNNPIQRPLNPRDTRQALFDAFHDLQTLGSGDGIVQAVNKMAELAQVNVYDIEDEQLLEVTKNEVERRKKARAGAAE